MYVGGDFTTVAGTPRNNLAAIDAASGAALLWNANAHGGVYALGVNGSTVFAGGGFSVLGGESRSNLAAVDVTSNAVLPWMPFADSTVSCLAAGGATVYVGGDFRSVNGQPRYRLAAVDAASGTVLPWSTGANNTVEALSVSGPRVYAAGAFTTVGGQSRYYLAALDAASGTVLPWNPGANDEVRALVVSGATVYVGGGFFGAGGQSRHYLAAIDAASGGALPWNPGTYPVYTLAISDSTVYAGGEYGYLAAIGAASGVVLPWSPWANNPVRSLVVSDTTVYAGGEFTTISSQSRHYLGAIGAASGAVLPWNPVASGYVRSLAVSGATVYAGGSFFSVGGQSHRGLARILDAASIAPLDVSVSAPNGNQTLVIGTTYRTRWDVSGGAFGAQSADVYLSRGGPTGPWELLAAAVTGRSYYDWQVTGPECSNAYLWVDVRDWSGAVASDIGNASFTIATAALDAPRQAQPLAFELTPPAPNPARGRATLVYTVPRPAHVRLSVLDVQGREVAVLADGAREAGHQVAALNASQFAAGLYFIRLQAPGADLRQKFLILN